MFRDNAWDFYGCNIGLATSIRGGPEVHCVYIGLGMLLSVCVQVYEFVSCSPDGTRYTYGAHTVRMCLGFGGFIG